MPQPMQDPLRDAPPSRPWAVPFDDRASTADIAACFRLILGRNPNPEEWPGHSARAGEPLAAVVSSYVNSLEFARRRLQDPSVTAPARADLNGFSILASPDDAAVGRTVLAGMYEPDVVAVFRRVLRPGMNVLDVGGNIGFFSMLSASIVGPKGSVFTVEPNPANARMAEASRRLNGFNHMTVFQAAAGRVTGMLVLNSSFSNGTTSAVDGDAVLGATTVPCVALDSVVPADRPIHLIKLDVEGAEYNALLGCQGIIAGDRPMLVFEFGPGQLQGISGVTGEELLQWVIAQGYTLSVIQPDGSTPSAGRDVEAVMQAYRDRGVDHIDVFAQPEPAAALRFMDRLRAAWRRATAAPRR